MIADGRVVEADGMLRLASESDNTVPIGAVMEASPITMHNGSRAQRSVSFQRYTVERVIDASPNPVTVVVRISVRAARIDGLVQRRCSTDVAPMREC